MTAAEKQTLDININYKQFPVVTKVREANHADRPLPTAAASAAMSHVVAPLCLCLCLNLVRVGSDLRAMQRYFIHRSMRPNTAPLGHGYLYTQFNDAPATLHAFTNMYENHIEKRDANKNTTKEMTVGNSTQPSEEAKTASEATPTTDNTGMLNTIGNIMWPPRGNAHETLKFAASNIMNSFNSMFRIDDDDIRNDFKNFYDIWPFFYQKMYAYEPKKPDAVTEKAKDKTFVVPITEKIIPVHEHVEETVINPYTEYKMNSAQDYRVKDKNILDVKGGTTDNPNYGNQPFFSYVLNDYFDKTGEDDASRSTEMPWGKDFDHEMKLQEIDDYVKRMRRLEEAPNAYREDGTSTFKRNDDMHETLKSKGRDSNHESESKKKGDSSKHNYDGSYRYDGENYRGFKDFADSFANRYGSEDHDRAANYAKKNNADKGDKKKGFRKIYHKDEYQELHDFFDNKDDSENAEEKGASKVHIGGSEGFLRSVAGAATGSDQHNLSHEEDAEKNMFEDNHQDKKSYSGIDRELDQYRDIARHTALSNNAESVDRYVI